MFYLNLASGDCVIRDCEDLVHAFYADPQLSHVETRLADKIKEYRTPQDDSRRNQDTAYGASFNELVKYIAQKVSFLMQFEFYRAGPNMGQPSKISQQIRG